MELRSELPQREVELRCEDEHRQRGLEPDRSAVEAHADRDRDECDTQGRSQLEHRA
jgi:hypothetical protein